MKRALIALLVIIAPAVTLWMSCEKQPQSVTVPQEYQQEMSLSKAAGEIIKVMDIQDRHTDVLLAENGVIGTAKTVLPDGRYTIKILTRDIGVEMDLPKVLDDIPVVYEAVGEIRALSFTDRYRPDTSGLSGGNINDRSKVVGYMMCSGSTICSFVHKNGTSYFLSNNRVFTRENKAAIGEDIVQRGIIEVNCSQITNDVVADLSQFKTIVFKRIANNTIDAAIAQIRAGIPFAATNECGYTPNSTLVNATVGMLMKTCGHTPEYTEG